MFGTDNPATIDLKAPDGSDADPDLLTSLIGNSISATGFVRLRGGLAAACRMPEVSVEVKKFFDLPEQEKRRYELPEAFGSRGYTTYGQLTDNSAPPVNEYWHYGNESSSGKSVLNKYRRNIWPEYIPQFRTAVLQVYSAMEEVSTLVLRSLSIYLGEDPGFLQRLSDEGERELRIINYPALTLAGNEVVSRFSAHEDWNLLSVYPAATNSGLQILSRTGQWVEIENEPGTVIANAGSLLEELSNNLFYSATHRVIASAGNCGQRISYAMFHNLADTADIRPGATVLQKTTNQKRRTNCSTALEYLQYRTRDLAERKRQSLSANRLADGRSF